MQNDPKLKGKKRPDYWKCPNNQCGRFNKVLADIVMEGDILVCCFCKQRHLVNYADYNPGKSSD